MTLYPYNAGNMTMTIPIAKFADLHDKIKQLEAENARLKAEVERLTKAGDEMANNIPRMVTCQVTSDEAVELRDAWNAAKGVQS